MPEKKRKRTGLKRAIKLMVSLPDNLQRLSTRDARTLVSIAGRLGAAVHLAVWRRAYPEVL